MAHSESKAEMTRRAVSRLPIAVRPGRGRAASACGAAAFLLSGLVAFLLTAAGSERGAAGQSYVASGLGAPTTTASLVRQPARGTRVAIGHSGYAVSHGSYTLTLDSQQLGRSRWQRFENGAARRTAFGSVAITVDPLKTEELLTVDRHLGPRTWRWRLGDETLELHARADGSVDVPARGRVPGFEILPVEILDRAGRQITPAGLRWSLAKHGGSSWLELRLDDSQLPRPYVIDPATITLRTPTTATTGGAAAGSLSVAMPTGTAYDDLMIAQITVGGGSGTAITPPSGWTLLRRDDNGTNVSTALYTHVAGAGEAGPYRWSFSPNAVAAGGILAYAGVDQSVALQTSGGTGGSNKNMVAPAITTTSANEKVIDFNGALTSGKVTAPTGSTPTFTEEYDPQATFDIEAADGTYASAASTGTKTAVASSNTYWVSQLVGLTLDTTLPTNAYSLVNVSPTGNAYLSGTTLWYKGNNGGGSFQIETAVTDTGSGPNSANYPNLGGTTTGWTHTGGNITAPAGGPYDSNAFTWANNTVSSPTETITSKDNATNKTANYVITFTNDTTAPNADGSIAFTGLTGTGSVYSPSTTLSLSLADGTDSGSGVDTSNEVLQRASATLSSANGLADGTCGTFGSFSTIATDTSSTFTDDAADGIQSGHCYRYQFIVSDHVGNTRTYTSSDVKVDATAPTTPSLTITPVSGTAYEHVSGTQIYYNPNGSNSGSFNVDASDASVSDADSGITKVSFAALPGFTGGGDDTTPTPWRGAYSWTNASTTSPGAQTVTETNNATGASTAGFTVTKDATAPSTTDNTASIGSAWRNTNATVTLTPSDSGAGVAATYYTTDGSTPTTSSAQGTTINLTADGTYTIKYFSVDRVGNSEPVETASTQIRIDKTSPTASTLSALPAAIENGQTLSASATDGGPSGIASVAYYECPGTSCTPSTLIGSSSAGPNYSLTWSSQPADGSYQVLARASDAAGNTLDSAKQTVTVDNTAPSVTQTDPGANLRGTVSIGATASDGGGSGIATVALQRSPAGAGTWATIGTASSTPYSVSFDTTAVSDGLYDFRAIATDNAGNQTTSATVTSRRVDNTAPTATMGNPGANVRGTVTLTSTTSDSGSGVASIAYEYSPTGAAGWTATPSSWNTTLVGDGLYDLRVIAVDAAGNSTTSVAVTNVRVDNTAPATSLTDPGANLSSTATLAATGTDTGGSGVASVAFQYSPAGAGTWTTISTDATSPYSASWNTSGVGDGLYDLRTVATDNAGNQTPSTVVTSRRVDNTSPTGSLTAPTAAANLTGTVTVASNSADAGSGVAAALFQYSPAGAGIWTTIASDSTAPYSVSWDTTGVANGSYDLRVTTTDNAANTFANTITVVVDNQAPGKPSLSFGSFTNAFQTGSTVYFRPGASGGFTVTGTSTSGPSGIASLAFPASIGSGWAGGGVDSSSPFQGVYTFGGAAPAEPANLHVTATSGAGLTSVQSDPFSLVADATAPATTILCGGAACASGWYTSGVVVSMSATDGGSGVDRIRYTTDGSTPDYSTNGTTYSSPPALTSNTTLKVRSFDNVGNAEAVQTLVLQIDTNPPTVSIASPSAGGAVANGATLTASAADADSGVADVQLGYCPGSSCTWGSGGFTTIGSLLTSAPYRVTWSGQPADGTYTLLARAHDDVGNVTVSSPVTVTVDNTAPAAAMGNPGANVRGTVALSSTTSDAGSGISTVGYQYSPSGAGSWTATPSSWDTTALADGLYDLRATATDNAGNQTTSANAVTVRVDNTPPTTSLTNPGANVRGTVALSSSTSDAGSGVASVAFQRSPAGAGSWTTIGTDATAPYSLSFDTAGVADGQYDLRTVASDAAGNQTASAVVTSRVDNTAPAAAMGNPGANARGTVALNSTTSDAGSGVASVAYAYSPSGAGAWTATASSWDTTALADGLYDLRATATDNAGNQTTSANAVTVRVDNTPPSGSLTDPGPSLAATVPLSATGADAGSGVASVAFQRSPAGTGSWTTIGTDATAPYSLSFDTTGVADGQYDLRAVVTDAAGNQTATAVVASRRIDNTAPTGSLTAPAAGAAVAGSSVLVSSSSADGGSGVALVAFQRSPAGAGTWTTIGTAGSSPYQVTWDTTGLADGSYDLRAVTTDVAGNSFTSATRTVTVDNTVPTAPALGFGSFTNASATGSTVYYRPGVAGGFTVTGTSTAGPSGVASLAFPSLGSGWSGGGADPTSPYQGVYGYNGTPAEPGAGQTATATSTAGLTSAASAPFSVVADATAPATTVTCSGAPCSGWYPSTVTVALAASDGASGVDRIRYTTDGTTPDYSTNGTTYGGSFTVGATTTVEFRAFDNVGNAESVQTVTIQIDTAAPTGSLTAPAASADVRGTVTVSSNSADTGGAGVISAAFQRSPHGAGTWTTIGTAVGSPYQVTWDTTGVADGLYDLRVVTTDGAGNQTTSATVANVRVDNTAPTATMTSPGANVRGTVTLGSTTSDAGSGVASTVYQWSPAGLGTWTSLAGTSWDTTGVTDGLYDLRVIATDNAGNQTTSAAVTSVRVDNTAPTATMTSPGANVRGTITLGSTTSDSGSGVASVQYQYSTAGAGSWNNTAAAWNTTLLSDGLYDLRVIATDGAGNQTASVKVSNVRVDNTAPTVSMAAPSGSLVGTVTLASTPADGGSGIQTVTFQISPNGQSSWSTIGTSSASPWSLAWDSTTVSDGRYDFRAVAADKAGNTTTSALVASKQVMNHPPTVSITAPGLYVNASAPNPFTITATTTTANGATVSSVQFFRCSDASVNCATGSYVSLGTDTTSPYTVSWALDAEGNRALEAIVTDSHGSTGQDVVNTLIDLTPPSGTSISYGNGYDNTGSVAIATGNGSDSGSGINTVSGVIQRDSATLANGACGSWNGSWTTVSNPDTTVASTTCYRYRYTVSDLAGNSTTATSTNAVREDSFAPTVSLGAIGANLRGTVTLTATAADTGGSGMASVMFQRSPTGAGTWTTIGTATGASPYSLDFDTTAAADGVYDFRAVAADAAGNQTASTLATGKRIDNTAPSVTLTSPGAVVRTTVSLSASASDGGSGLASTVYQYSPAGAGAWTTTPASWDTTLRADGLYDVRAVATDLAGNSASSTVTNVRIDNTAPTVTLGDPGANLRGNVSLAATAADSGGSGIASVAFQRSPAGAGTWTTIGTATGPFSLSFDTTSVADGVYDLRAIATDAAGNQTTSAVVTSRLVDNTAPTGSLTAPANGAKLAGASVTVAASSADAGSGVASVVFQRSPAGAGTWTAIGTATSSPYQRSWDTTAVADGNYDLRAVTTDAAGNSFTSATTTVTVDNTAPPAPTLSFGSFSNAAQSGSTIYYRPGTSGGFTVTGTGSDGASGIDHFTFPSLGSGWSGGGVSSAPYQAAYSYNGTPAQPGGGQTVTYANGAGTTSAVSNPFAVVADSTAPTSAITCNGGPCSGWYPGPVTVALSANDAGSGLDRIRYTTNGVDPDYSTTGTTYIATFVVGNTATVKYRAFDNVGNAEPVRSQVIQIDAVAPTGSLTAPADGTSAAGTLTVASSSADTGGSGV
ncbi:MAG TPA: Ig-like domain-containing protein, partial [Gaiellaceae bacterium]|nr:Ig-like domain-containing protein [Gaiellaceae bacterium]